MESGASEIIGSESVGRKWLYREGGQAEFEAGSANFVFILFLCLLRSNSVLFARFGSS